jgi:hypothetical protein
MRSSSYATIYSMMVEGESRLSACDGACGAV